MIKIGLRNLNCEEKVELAMRITTGLKITPAYKNSHDLVNQLEESADFLTKAIDIAAYGDKRGIEARKLLEKQLDNIIRRAAAYVNLKSNGDIELIQAAGFEVRKRNNKATKPEKPKELKIKRTTHIGQLKLNWKPVKNSRNYLVQFKVKGQAQNATWNTMFSTRSSCTIESLTPGKVYKIRIVAVGAKGMSEPSEVLEIMAA